MTEAPPHLEPEHDHQPRSRSASGLQWVARTAVRAGVGAACILAVYLAVCSCLIIAYRWIDPPTTVVQSQRRLEAIGGDREYSRVYTPRPSALISRQLLHAVVAAEDNRFFEHQGFDWDAIETAYREGGRRGGSTISQQLAKNLFLTTYRSYLRKALEVPLTLLIEVILPKDRILELYVNVIEWGDGVYGAEAAARHHFGVSADRVTRRQAAALASCLPDPRRRRPRLNGWYTNVILRRMDQMGY